MNFIVNYLFESALILGLLTAFYWSVLHREASFRFNRFYLLLSLMTATFVPLLTFSFYLGASEANGDVYVGYMLNAVNVYAQQSKEVLLPLISESSAFKWL